MLTRCTCSPLAAYACCTWAILEIPFRLRIWTRWRGERRLVDLLLALAGARATIARGATLLPKTNALAVNIRAGKVTGLTTAKSTIEAPVVVDAAGAWTRQVAEASGIRVPLVPTYRPRRQLIVTEPSVGASFGVDPTLVSPAAI